MTDEPPGRVPDDGADEPAGRVPGDDGESGAAAAGAAPDDEAGDGDGAGGDGEPGAEVSDVDGGAPRSGLRNPAGALRGVGAGVLVIEALVLLLAVLPLRMLKAPGWGMAAVAILALAALVLTGLLKRHWVWYAGIVLQALVIATGLAHWSVAVIGCIFGGIWLYVLHIRRTILGRI